MKSSTHLDTQRPRSSSAVPSSIEDQAFDMESVLLAD